MLNFKILNNIKFEEINTKGKLLRKVNKILFHIKIY